MTAVPRTWLRAAGLAALAIAVLLWAMSGSRDGAEHPANAPAAAISPPAATTVAVRGAVPIVEEAVGPVDSRRRVVVAAQVIARVLAVGPAVGDQVAAGVPLVTLDDSDVAARFTRARAQYQRVRGFLARQAATAEQMETAEAEYRQAEAAMAHTRIAAPIAGIVAERHVEPGDLASPGHPLLVLLDPTALRLEARVREGLIGRIVPGATLDVRLPTADLTVRGTVAEVLPAADPQSRTFEVRVDFDPVPGVHPGMFGRLRVPVGEREVVRVPAAAVTRVGQLETVLVQRDGAWSRRLVTTGATLPGGDVEVLSGLAGGETVGLADAP